MQSSRAVICGSPEQKVELERYNEKVYDILDFNEEIGGNRSQTLP